MKYDKNELYIGLLHRPLINKNLINGCNDYNYEIYLTELINNSKFEKKIWKV